MSWEVDLANPGGITGTPTFLLTATQSEALAGGPGTMLYTQRFTRNVSGAGDFDISDLPRGDANRVALNRTFFQPDANNITRGIIERNSYIVFDPHQPDQQSRPGRWLPRAADRLVRHRQD
ncbi:MAG: hypothetical protein WDM77_09845 [Steroidobacteraceae bacterium]